MDSPNATVDFSVTIPAYNESKRLPALLDRMLRVAQNSKYSYEVIVVDDGSTDGTFELASSRKLDFERLSVIRLKANSGKGYAVRRGMLASVGRISVFLDADGSTDPDEIEKNAHYLLDEGYDIFVGSRVLRAPGQALETKPYRTWIGKMFNGMVAALLFKGIADTQCGFKMFRTEIIKPIFARSHLRGFGFDLEILYLAFKMGYRVKEGAVSWKHRAGSKVHLVADSAKMFLNILQVRNWHVTPVRRDFEFMGPNEYEYMYDLEKDHWWFVARRELALRLIRKLASKKSRVLDLGSGTGENVAAFAAEWEVTGLESSAQAIGFCRKRGLNNIVPGTMQRLPFVDGAYDVVTCLDALEHVPDPVAALSEARRVLKPGGVLIVFVPAFQYLWSQHDEALGHYRRYGKRSLREELEGSGLRPVKMSYMFLLSFFFVAPVRLLRRLVVGRRAPGDCRSDTTTLPPKALNAVLKVWFRLEGALTVRWGLPFGTTLLAIAMRDR